MAVEKGAESIVKSMVLIEVSCVTGQYSRSGSTRIDLSDGLLRIIIETNYESRRTN
jgi:hypothetical protein